MEESCSGRSRIEPIQLSCILVWYVNHPFTMSVLFARGLKRTNFELCFHLSFVLALDTWIFVL